MQKILFLQPQFQTRIWGGNRLKTVFDYDIPNDKTGECWAISAHKNGDCIISNGEFAGMTLSSLYNSNRELFGNCESETFPLLTKILDANDDLSIQVHPDDNCHLASNESGKSECWYIIDCDDNAEMVLGHNAKTREELEYLVSNNKWDKLLRKINIKPHDFYYVPAGTIHALCKGTLVLETQQSSDITYRLYDYDRTDEMGKRRELHLDEAIAVATVPHQSFVYNREITRYNNTRIAVLVKSPYFTVERWEVMGNYRRDNDNHFFLVSCLKGAGRVLNEPVKMGDHFIITSLNHNIYCQGNMELIVSYL